jgi:hypothetical protein
MSTALCPLSKRCKPFSELLPPSLHGDPTTRIHGGMRHGVNLDPAEDDVRQRLRFCVPAFVQRCAAHGKKSWRPEANCHERRDDFHLRQRVRLAAYRMSAALIAAFFLPIFMNGKTFVAYVCKDSSPLMWSRQYLRRFLLVGTFQPCPSRLRSGSRSPASVSEETQSFPRNHQFGVHVLGRS